MFAVKQGCMVDNAYVPPMSTDLASTEDSSSEDKTFSPGLTYPPAWLANDKKVLCFHGYFKETVPTGTSNVETWRVRKCVFYYYLEDDSMAVMEPKVDNSGLRHGALIKRHCIPKGNQGYVKPADLHVGAEIVIYGRIFYLVDADEYTRQFYKDCGESLAVSMNYPMDSFTKKKKGGQNSDHHKRMNPMKEHMEAALGKQFNATSILQKKFLANDRKVLRFYCVWDDDRVFGEQRPFILHFFLADDTVEVLEVNAPNSGRGEWPALLKRQQLMKNFREYQPAVFTIGITRQDQNIHYYKETDLKVGGSVEVYGRQMFIRGADTFTKEYYIKNHGMTETDFPHIDIEGPEEPVPQIAVPEYNGFGTEEDSLGSFLHLMPKVPKGDFKKWMENDGINLRFEAKFTDPDEIDSMRRFVITYYMNNDSMSVFEKFERNSGFLGGKFLEKNSFVNNDTGVHFSPGDLYKGAKIMVNTFKFEIFGVDEFTRKFMEAHPDVWPTRTSSTVTTEA